MHEKKVTFENKNGDKLSGKLILPVTRKPLTYAIFAHCFSCGKDLKAARVISNKLAAEGIAVLRFDFSGLGESEGDFGQSALPGNIEDILAAAEYLRSEHQAASLLIGHSLGGAAVIRTAQFLPEVKAVSTIGAPFDSSHIKNLFSESLETIIEKGKAKVEIAGRSFEISKNFLDDISKDKPEESVNKLDRALLVLHSPQDTIVSIDNAALIYTNAKHPKSFISLDGADHLLSNNSDAEYTADIISTWVKKYLVTQDVKLETKKQSVASTYAGTFITEINAGGFTMLADEPSNAGGSGLGPTPYDLLTAALGACTSMTLQMYAGRKSLDLEEVRVHVQHNRDYAKDCDTCDDPNSKIDVFEREIELIGDIDDAQRSKLLSIANKCPVHKTLENTIEVRTVLL